MNSGSLNELKARVAALAVTDAASFLAWLPLAARLAALGLPEALRRWTMLVRSLGLDLDRLLCARATEGVRDLRSLRGPDLASALADAQDFSFFLDSEAEILPGRARSALRAWREETEAVVVDERAEDDLARLRERLGPDSPRLLPALARPTIRGEAALLAALAPRLHTLHWRWSRREDGRTRADSRDLARDFAPGLLGSPPREERRALGRFGDGRDLIVTLVRESDRTISIQFDPAPRGRRVFFRGSDHGTESIDQPVMEEASIIDEMAAPAVRAAAARDPRPGEPPPDRVYAVRLGRQGARPASLDARRWTIDLPSVPEDRREDLLDQPLVFSLRAGLRVVIGDDQRRRPS